MSVSSPAQFISRRQAVRLGGGLAAALTLAPADVAVAQDQGSAEANKVLVHRLFREAVNLGRANLIAELYAPDFVNRGAWPVPQPGPAGIAQSLRHLQATIPGLQVIVEEVLAERDLVAARINWRGSHPPAGTHLLGKTLHIFRLADQAIIEEWSAGWDWLTRLDSGAST